MEQISISNKVIKEIREQKKHNINKNIFILEDLFILGLRKKYNFNVLKVIFCEEKCYSEEALDILKFYKSICNEIYSVSSKTYDFISEKDNSAGIIAVVEIDNKTFSDVYNPKYILVNDGIELPGNLGTIYRTADAVGINLIINVDSKTNINNSKVISSSRGMNLIIPTINCTYEEAQEYLIKNDYNIYLGEPELGTNYKDLEYIGKTVIVVGNERFGINKNWYDNKHIKVFIPMYGEMTSLNVGVAASILMYEVKHKIL